MGSSLTVKANVRIRTSIEISNKEACDKVTRKEPTLLKAETILSRVSFSRILLMSRFLVAVMRSMRFLFSFWWMLTLVKHQP